MLARYCHGSGSTPLLPAQGRVALPSSRSSCWLSRATPVRWLAVRTPARPQQRLFCSAPPKSPPKMAPPPAPGTGVPRGGPARGQARPGEEGGISQTQGPINWRNFLLAMAFGGSITAAFKYMEIRLAEDRFRGVGKAALGGPFDLVDQDGKPFSDADLKGGWALLYFGFTFCPDICPNELKKITVVVDALDKSWYAGPIVRPVLITVDPRRDSAPKMKDYIQQFHPRFVGLTGSEDQVRKVTKAYRVYFNPTNEDDENYLVDHSIIAYLLNPEGEFVAFYGQEELAATMIPKVESQIWEYRKRAFWKSVGLL